MLQKETIYLIFNANELKKSLKTLSTAVSKKYPILKNIMFSVGKDEITLITSNSEYSISTTFHEHNDVECSFLVDFKELKNAINSCEKVVIVQFYADSMELKINHEQKLKTFDTSEFPTLILPNYLLEDRKTIFKQDSNITIRHLETALVCAQDKYKYFKTDAVVLDNDNIVASSSKRMYTSKLFEVSRDFVMLDQKVAKQVLNCMKNKKDSTLTIYTCYGIMELTIGDYTIYTKQPTGQYPNWEIALPQKNDFETFSIDHIKLLQELKKSKNETVVFEVVYDNHNYFFEVDGERLYKILPIKSLAGITPTKKTFNRKYIIEFLKTIKKFESKCIQIEIFDTPLVFSNPYIGWQYLQMPIEK